MWSLVLLTLALSIDGLIVGVSYGRREIRIPPRSLGIVAACTLTGITLSMSLGQLMGDLMQPALARTLGGLVLICLGLWQMLLGWLEDRRNALRQGGVRSQVLARLRLRSLGIAIQVLQEPACADRDHSGIIEPKEALLLGVALGLDTLAAGLAASLVGLGWLLVVTVPAGLVILIELGIIIGHKRGSMPPANLGAVAPAAVLILMGLLKLI
ncbi:MAG: sporulation membrane protein YtaF [Limnochordia bacterium]